MEKLIFGGLFIVLGGLIWWGIVATSQHRAEWEANCHSLGGTVTSDTDVGSGVAINPSSGQPGVVVTSNTDYFCMSDDGRILDMD